MLRIDVKTTRKWHPFGLVDELLRGTTALFFVSHDPVVDVHVIDPQSTLLGQRLDIDVVADNLSVGFLSLWT